MPDDRRLAGPLDIKRFVSVAVSLARWLTELHGRGAVHGRLTTDGVRIGGDEVAVESPPEDQLEYLSPEQTGRLTHAAVDARSDLYSLGVVFFELLTGRLPFSADDPAEWVHAHLAQIPPAPAELRPELPATLSGLVARLLAKAPEERYQSARGLLADLERCAAALRDVGGIPPFELGRHDVAGRLVLPEQLYGREQETAALMAAFDRVALRGRPELVLVRGPAGIGKSALVSNLRDRIAARGVFVAGKFDEQRGEHPYSAIGQVVAELVEQLLAESDEELNWWRDHIRSAVGSHAAVLAHLAPAAWLLVGEQPGLADLGAEQLQQRFQQVVRRFLSLFTRPDAPLVIFLDDLQWADPPSVELLVSLLWQPAVGPLLLISAHRDAPGQTAAAVVPVEQVAQRDDVTQVTVGPLAAPAVRQLLANTLGASSGDIAPLPTLVLDKTGGNPFFISQFLAALRSQGLLAFDEQALRWRWDANGIAQAPSTDNVAQVITERLATLGAPTRGALAAAACLGSRFDLQILAMAIGVEAAEAEQLLSPAVSEGLLIRLRDEAGDYGWAHDKVQEAARGEIPEADLGALHLAVGRALLAETQDVDRSQQLFDIVDHCNAGRTLISEPEERMTLARAELAAARRAIEVGAFAAGRAYAEAGSMLLPSDAWTSCYELARDLHLQGAACAAAAGDYPAAQALLADALLHARSDVDSARLLAAQSRLFVTVGEHHRALAPVLDGLRRLGIRIPDDASQWPGRSRAAHARIRKRLDALSDEQLIATAEAPERALVSHQLLIQTVDAAYATEPELEELAACHLAEHALRWRHPQMLAVAYSRSASALLARGWDHQRSGRLLHACLRLLELPEAAPVASRVIAHLAHVLDVWHRPLSQTRALLMQGYETGLTNGDMQFAHGCRALAILAALGSGEPLVQVATELRAALEDAEASGQFLAAVILRALHAGISDLVQPALDALSPAPPQTVGLRELFDRGVMPWWSSLDAVIEVRERYLAGHHRAALDAAARFNAAAWHAGESYLAAEHRLYRALSLAALQVSRSAAEDGGAWQTMEEDRQHFERWSRGCPANFEHAHLLLSAELARLSSDAESASRLYGEAAASAQRHGFVHVEALAHDLAARHAAAIGDAQEEDRQLHAARQSYYRWGATSVAQQIERRHPQLSAPAGARLPGEPIDLSSVINASQAISEEIHVERLAERLLGIMVQHAGAERGCLLLDRGQQRWLAAEAVVDGRQLTVRVLAADEAPALAESVVNYVRRAGEPMIVDDARTMSRLSRDKYVAAQQPRSIACMPIGTRGDSAALLYLEHRTLAGAFTPERVSVLTHLAAQAAISLENAGLYADLAAEQAALSESEARFRTAFEEAPIGMAIIDGDLRLLDVNRALTQTLGSSAEDLIGRRLDDIAAAAEPRMLLESAEAGTAVEHQLRHAWGHWIWGQLSAARLDDGSDQPARYLLQLQDVTEQRRLLEALEHQALHDPVTGLPNRTLLDDRLRLAMHRAARRGASVAALVVDLDRFHLINESLGYGVGDQLLMAVGRRLKSILRPGDTAARIAGDRFGVVCEDVHSDEDVLAVAERTLAVFEEPFLLDGRDAHVSASIGVAVAFGGGDPAAVLTHADAALHRAKAKGKGRYELFDEELALRALDRLRLESDLRAAVSRGELRLVYQPILRVEDGRLHAVEALLRWQRDDEVLLPQSFIPIAEETGLIVSMGEWVFGAACRQAAAWRERFGERAPRVWVNLSAREVGEAGLADMVGRSLADSGAQPGLIGLEITESALMHDAAVARSSLDELHALGVALAVDDFGTGYSSFAYLRRFRVDELKIDRSFAAELPGSAEGRALIGAMLSMGRALGLEVVVEGIETEQMLEAARQLGCDLVQGFALGHPGPPEAIEQTLEEG